MKNNVITIRGNRPRVTVSRFHVLSQKLLGGARLIALWVLLLSLNSAVATDEKPIFIVERGYKGLIGDGVSDDTHPFQEALAYCSESASTCLIAKSVRIFITEPVFIWGDADLVSAKDAEIIIGLTDHRQRFVINLGISSQNRPATVFTGTIRNNTFRVVSGPTKKGVLKESEYDVGGRIIKYWRSQNSRVSDNKFYVDKFMYAGIGSQIHRKWLAPRSAYVLKDTLISGNSVYAKSKWNGMEGLGLTAFDGARIENNKVVGVGDDTIGIHKCKNISISGNTLQGLDGRLLVVGSSNIEIKNNFIERIPSRADGKFSNAQALIRVGSNGRGRIKNSSGITIDGNTLLFPEGARDNRSAILISGASNIVVSNNTVINNALGNRPVGVLIKLPKRRKKSKEKLVLKNENIQLKNNKFSGEEDFEATGTYQCEKESAEENIVFPKDERLVWICR